jgi:hypothetical protein
MDDPGLNVLGLPDLQRVFHSGEEDPNVVFKRLYDLAGYLLDTGAVIGIGETVGDIDGGPTWRAREATRGVGPSRQVLELSPA